MLEVFSSLQGFTISMIMKPKIPPPKKKHTHGHKHRDSKRGQGFPPTLPKRIFFWGGPFGVAENRKNFSELGNWEIENFRTPGKKKNTQPTNHPTNQPTCDIGCDILWSRFRWISWDLGSPWRRAGIPTRTMGMTMTRKATMQPLIWVMGLMGLKKRIFWKFVSWWLNRGRGWVF